MTSVRLHVHGRDIQRAYSKVERFLLIGQRGGIEEAETRSRTRLSGAWPVRRLRARGLVLQPQIFGFAIGLDHATARCGSGRVAITVPTTVGSTCRLTHDRFRPIPITAP